VAATAVDGCVEIITDGVDGLLVPPSRPRELAAAVSRLLTEPGLAGSIVDRAHIRVQDWDRRTMSAQISELYDQVVASHG
jgi:glycosyltransferase involved in cell wall biosynthesis